MFIFQCSGFLFFCYVKYSEGETTWGGEQGFPLILLGPSPSLRETSSRSRLEPGGWTEAEPMEEG